MKSEPKRPHGHGIHHFDFASYGLYLTKLHRNGHQGMTMLIKESDDPDGLVEMGRNLYPWLPADCTLELVSERDNNHYTRVIRRWEGQQSPSPRRHHRFEWVEDEA